MRVVVIFWRLRGNIIITLLLYVIQAQRELGVLLTEPPHRDLQRAVALFQKAAEQQVLLSSVLAFVFVLTTLHRAWSDEPSA